MVWVYVVGYVQWGAANHMRFACVVCSLHVVYRVLATLRCDGSVAQRMRASVSGTEGRGFESLQAHFCVVSGHRSGVFGCGFFGGVSRHRSACDDGVWIIHRVI